ncbi:MAG: hypothetical protein GTN80_02120 [Nitrososphaeria archaeon]|nr:hypothetical protein [Nitrososphaeria archaeon]NIN51887.1 hypothetical protein [Nitrososphaeria archaeon]NIQ32435.1 hypothetical protein [Nitrososphaeria archaeon]
MFLDAVKHFQRMYPGCSTREISDLVSAIRSKKYWNVHPQREDAIYVVALTSAKIPDRNGFKAGTTASNVVVSRRVSRFARRGRVLVASDRRDHFYSETVIEWPAFRRLIRQEPDAVYRFLLENPHPPSFINCRNIAAVLREINADPQEL